MAPSPPVLAPARVSNEETDTGLRGRDCQRHLIGTFKRQEEPEVLSDLSENDVDCNVSRMKSKKKSRKKEAKTNPSNEETDTGLRGADIMTKG